MPPTLEISIPTTSASATSPPYTLYNITLRLPLRSFTLSKRYSDFLSFHTNLISQTTVPPPALSRQRPGSLIPSLTRPCAKTVAKRSRRICARLTTPTIRDGEAQAHGGRSSIYLIPAVEPQAYHHPPRPRQRRRQRQNSTQRSQTPGLVSRGI